MILTVQILIIPGSAGRLWGRLVRLSAFLG
jgi:hypothetical protein